MYLETTAQYQQNLRATSQETRPLSQGFLRLLVGMSTALAALIFCLISLGGLVRNAGAGLSCPDWPLCYGKVVPPMDMQVFLEWFHRLIAGSVSILLLALAACIFYNPFLYRRLFKHVLAAVSLLGAQVALGAMTVLGLLDPKWVSSHLAIGIAFFGVVLTLALELRELKAPRLVRQNHLYKGVLIAMGALYGQIILGGLVSSNYAGLACPDFPTCNGAWIPVLAGLVRFQFLHRLGAIVAAASLLALTAVLWKKSMASPRLILARWALPCFLGAQVFLGIGSVLFKLPLLMSVAHLATAAALFGLLVMVRYEIRRC